MLKILGQEYFLDLDEIEGYINIPNPSGGSENHISVISTIKNGVKHVEDGDWLDQDERVDDIIENAELANGMLKIWLENLVKTQAECEQAKSQKQQEFRSQNKKIVVRCNSSTKG